MEYGLFAIIYAATAFCLMYVIKTISGRNLLAGPRNKSLALNCRTGALIISVLTTAVMVYLALAIGTATVLRPWVDEGWGGAPAWNLITNGSIGTPSFHAEAWGMTGIEQHTYWFMPVFLLLQVPIYKLVGFSLIHLRLICVAFGGIALLSWIYFLWCLTRDRVTTLLFATFVCCDYILMTTAATGRPDIVAFAFQSLGFALYMYFREQKFGQAILLSQTCIMLSGMTHPNGGMLGLIGVCLLTFYLDRTKLRLRHYAIASVPYIIGAVCWGAYILQDVHGFITQYGYQTGMRFWGLGHPLHALGREFMLRYIPNMGLTAGHYAESTGPHWLKTYYFIAYAAGIIGTLCSARLRRTRAAQILLLMAGMFFCFMWLLEATKAAYYFSYIIFPFTAILALWVGDSWKSEKARPVLVAAVSLFVLLQAGGVLYRIKLNQWGAYKPMVAYLEQHAAPNDTIVGSLDLGFSIGFTPRFTDDPDLGLKSRPKFIILEEIYDGRMEALREKNAAKYHCLQQVLANYKIVFQTGQYRILERSDKIPGVVL
jgi:hypothetical protein